MRKYVTHFNRRFKLNGRDIEIYDSPKILSDIFESLIAAVFIDGGFEKTSEMLEGLIGPILIYVSKFCKALKKVPNDDFHQACLNSKIKPECIIRERQWIELPNGIADYLHHAYYIYKKDEVLCQGYGSSKDQAKTNACIDGLRALQGQ